MKKKQKKTQNKKTKFELSCGGVVYNKKIKKILIIKDLNNHFGFPKGKVEKDEPLLSAAKRETYEETGVKKLKFLAKIGEVKYFYKLKGSFIFKKVVYFLFETKQIYLTPQKEEIKKALWANLKEIQDKIKYKNTTSVIEETKKLIKQKYD